MSEVEAMWKRDYERMSDRAVAYAALLGRMSMLIRIATIHHVADPSGPELADAIADLNRAAAEATALTHRPYGSGE